MTEEHRRVAEAIGRSIARMRDCPYDCHADRHVLSDLVPQVIAALDTDMLAFAKEVSTHANPH